MTLYTRQDMVASNRVFQGHIVNMRVDKVESGDKAVTREVIEHPGGVIIACQPEPGQVVLVKQYRYSIDRELIELPAGRLDYGELPLSAAQRELKEETGYRAVAWRELSRMYSAPGFCDEILYLFHASQASLSKKTPDEDEETEVIILSVKEAWQQVLDGIICDAKTIAGLAMLS